MKKKLSVAITSALLALSSVSPAQTLQTLVNQPDDHVGVCYLLTDGTVMCQGRHSTDWSKLTPDISGSYLNGTWNRLAELPAGYAPFAFASSVLADGRLVIVGGEYNFDFFALTNKGAIYDPTANTWTPVKPPAGWDFIGESPSVVLPDGMFLVGRKLDEQMAVLDPATLTWTAVSSAGKSDFNAEEGWTLLPDGTVLTYDVKHAPNSEKYIPWLGRWVTAGSTVVDLRSPTDLVGCLHYGPHGEFCYFPPGEVGSATLRPDGTVFATGSFTRAGPGHTSVYTPPAVPTDPGTWTPGPDFPENDNGDDSWAVLLSNGNVLVQGFNTLALYEFDGVNLIPQLRAAGFFFLPLPTGEVLVTGFKAQLDTSSNTTFSPSWAPQITTYPTSVVRGLTYKISGQQFNGLSQASGLGDDWNNATNYPLARITNQATGHVFYARTHDHSTMAVATGDKIVSTNFDVPARMETGASSLEVVANGIPSTPVAITVN